MRTDTTVRYAGVRTAIIDVAGHLGAARRAFEAHGPGSEAEARQLEHIAGAALALALEASRLAYDRRADFLAGVNVLDTLAHLVVPELPIGPVEGQLHSARVLIVGALETMTEQDRG